MILKVERIGRLLGNVPKRRPIFSINGIHSGVTCRAELLDASQQSDNLSHALTVGKEI